MDNTLGAAIAVTRFGLGARPGEIAAASGDPRGFLMAQIRASGADLADPGGPGSAQRFGEFADYRAARKAARRDGDPKSDPVKMVGQLLRGDTGADFLARVRLGATTEAGFRERWALFWANHFTVSASKIATATLVGPFEAEAIRPHVFGPFADLLIASSSHPAMLLYLDQARSFGPDSPAAAFAARRGKTIGLNENLAREIMELHTVGLGADYTQADVTEFARAMTGWSIGGEQEAEDRRGRFLFRPFAHEPGTRTIMGRRYPQSGQDQALAVMKDLAASPRTAHHLAVEIAAHFVADDPPPSLVTRLETAYMASDGSLGEVARALVSAPEAWVPRARKFKTPYEFMVSGWRATGVVPGAIETVAPMMNAMGQRAFSAPSPKGWSEAAADWCTPDAVIKRMAWSEALGAQAAAGRDPIHLAAEALGARLSAPVAKAVARAETRPEAVAILLMSPEFQSR